MRTHSYHATWFVSFALLLAIATALACSCLPPPPPKEALGEAAAVFSGTVTEITLWPREVTIDGRKHTFPMKRVTFRVIETWKGTNTESLVVYTGQGGGDCGYHFVQGSNYLVYSHSMPSPIQSQSDFKVLTTSICTRTRDQSRAGEDLKALGVGQKPKTK